MRAGTLSLVVATRWRTCELRRFLDSLVIQTYNLFSVIVVDQNEDDRVQSLLQEYESRLSITHLRSRAFGKAAANNAGLAICDGEFVAFPDDDCWYAPDLLQRVVGMFEVHPEWHGITGCEASAETSLIGGRFDREAGQVTRQNVWRRHISFAMFFRRADLGGLVYDERLGIGAQTIWGSGEETEFLLQAMKRGCFVQYQPSVAVFHPDWGQGPYTMTAIKKARRYGMGMGRLLHAHNFPASVTLKYLYRPLLGGAYTLVLGRAGKAIYHWSVFVGRATGWIVSLLSSYDRPGRAVPRLSAK